MLTGFVKSNGIRNELDGGVMCVRAYREKWHANQKVIFYA